MKICNSQKLSAGLIGDLRGPDSARGPPFGQDCTKE